LNPAAAAAAAARYEVNPEMVPQLEASGLMFVAGIAVNTAVAAAAAAATGVRRTVNWRLSWRRPSKPLSLSNSAAAAAAARYEVNPEMVPQLEAAGLMFVGKDETGERMEVVELQESPSGHPFYAAAQVRRILRRVELHASRLPS
jgi:CTP synthase (UTP-ammonia lyase)